MDPREAVDRSCRGPVLFLAFSAVAWLLVYSLFALLAGVSLALMTGGGDLPGKNGADPTTVGDGAGI